MLLGDGWDSPAFRVTLVFLLPQLTCPKLPGSVPASHARLPGPGSCWAPRRGTALPASRDSSPASRARHHTASLRYSPQLLWELPWISVYRPHPPPITTVVRRLLFRFFLVIFTLKNAALCFFGELHITAVPSF